MSRESEMHHPAFWIRDNLVAAVERLEKELSCARAANEAQHDEIMILKNQRMALVEERDRYRFQAEQKMALRREIEALLGLPSAPASDEQLKAGFEALRAVVADAKKWRDRQKSLLGSTYAAD